MEEECGESTGWGTLCGLEPCGHKDRRLWLLGGKRVIAVDVHDLLGIQWS